MTKAQVLMIFARSGRFLKPDEVLKRLEPEPDRRSLTYRKIKNRFRMNFNGGSLGHRVLEFGTETTQGVLAV